MATKSFHDLAKDTCLSAKQLFKLHGKRDGTIPSKGGQKDFEPDGSWIQSKALEAFHQERTSVLAEQRVEKLKNLVQGVWEENRKLVNVDKPRKFWAHMGFTDKRRNWLYPEEALYLMEINALEVMRRGVSLSIQEAYNTFLGGDVKLSEYQVYAYLRRLGFVVLRHDVEQVLTKYERQMNINHYKGKRPLKIKKNKIQELSQSEKGGQSGDAELKEQVDELNPQEKLTTAGDNGDVSRTASDTTGGEPELSGQLDDKQSVVLPKEESSAGDQSIVTDDSSSALDVSLDSAGSNQATKKESIECLDVGAKRLRSGSVDEDLTESSGINTAKRVCLKQEDVKAEGKDLVEKESISGASTDTRMYYLESWSDCFVQDPATNQCGEVSKEESYNLKQTSWQDNSLKFPDLGEGKPVISLIVPEKKLIPSNVDIPADADSLQFNVEDYRQKNPVECMPRRILNEEDREKRVAALVFSFAEWTQKKPVVKSHNWADHKQKIESRLKELSSSTPVSHLWQGEVTPLVSPLDAWNTDSVLKKLSIIKCADEKDLKARTRTVQDSQLSFDVHLPDKSFKKTMPGTPDHRVVVCRSDDSPPKMAQLEAMRQTDDVPVHWAVVDSGEVAFYVFDSHNVDILR